MDFMIPVQNTLRKFCSSWLILVCGYDETDTYTTYFTYVWQLLKHGFRYCDRVKLEISDIINKIHMFIWRIILLDI